MKTKILKFVLPVFAVLVAVSFAFATKSTSVDQIGHYYEPLLGWQSIVVGSECGFDGEVPCKYMGKQLYSQRDTSSQEFRKH